MYTIGEFSKISHVSARMLRYYETLGLIHPAEIGYDNNYRYYESNQLSSILKIQQLQQYGVKLKDIPAVLSMSDENVSLYFHQLYQQLLKEQQALNSKINLLQHKLNHTEVNTMNSYDVILLNNPKQYVYGLKRTININVEEIHQLFEDLKQQMNDNDIQRTGVAQLVYLSEEFSHENMEVEAQYEVSMNTLGAHAMPACKCISVLHKGSSKTLQNAYEALGNWLSSHPEYHVIGPSIERFVNDHPEEENRITGILFPVAKQ